MEVDIKQLLEEQRKIFSEDMKGYIGMLVENFNKKYEVFFKNLKNEWRFWKLDKFV